MGCDTGHAFVAIYRRQGTPNKALERFRLWLREEAGRLDAVLVAGLKQEAYVALGAAQRTGAVTILLAEEVRGQTGS